METEAAGEVVNQTNASDVSPATAAAVDNEIQSESFLDRLTQILSMALPFPDLCIIYLDPVVSSARSHPYLSTVATLILVTWLVIRHFRNRKLPPGPWGWPLIGHLSYLLSNPHFRLSHLRDVYGDVYQLRCGGRRVVVVSSLDAVMQGLVERGQRLDCRPDFRSYDALYPASRQQGVCTADPDETFNVKKQFLYAAIDAYCSDAERIEDKLSSEVVDLVNQLNDLEEPFDPAPMLHKAFLNVTLNLTFSQRFDPCGRTASEILKTFQWRSSAFAFNAVDFFRPLKIFTSEDHDKYVRDLTDRLMQCNKSLLNAHKDTYDAESLRDLADQLLLYVESGEDSGLLQHDDIDLLLLDMAGYGHQATAVTLTWLLGYLALNPEVQGKVQEELDLVVGRDRLPCLADQPYLPLMEAALCEVHRLASVCPFLLPHKPRQPVSIQGFQVPADSVVLFNVWGLHHDPRYWPNPHRFDPQRFLKDGALEIPEQLLPYGAGPRGCPGESLADVQLFLFATALLHQLSFRPESQPPPPLEGVYDHLLRPKPFRLRAVQRE